MTDCAVAVMSHKRLDRLRKTIGYYVDNNILPIVCDNSPTLEWSDDDHNFISAQSKLYRNESFSFYDQLIWHAEFALKSNQSLISICPDEDIHLYQWIQFVASNLSSQVSNLPVTCFMGPSLSGKANVNEKSKIVNTTSSIAFAKYDFDTLKNARLSMIGQVPYLWRTYPTDFFYCLMKTVKWFGINFGDKIAEQIIWNLLIPSMGYVSYYPNHVQFVRRDSTGLRFKGLADIGRTPFLEEMKNTNINRLSIELESCIKDFPDRFLKPDKYFFSESMSIAVEFFSVKPWLYSSQDSFIYTTNRKKTYQEDGKLVLNPNDKFSGLDSIIAASLGLPYGAIDKTMIKEIYAPLLT